MHISGGFIIKSAARPVTGPAGSFVLKGAFLQEKSLQYLIMMASAPVEGKAQGDVNSRMQAQNLVSLLKQCTLYCTSQITVWSKFSQGFRRKICLS